MVKERMYERSMLGLLLLFFFLHSCVTLASDPDPIQDFCLPTSYSSTAFRPSHPPTLICKNSSEATADDFVFSGLRTPGNFTETGFATIPVNPANFPGLNTLGMSFVRADLKAGAVNPPHFHPRATEIAYLVKGKLYSGFVDSNNRVFSRIIEEGEVMVFPKGLVHFQMNVGDRPATIFASLNSQNPGLQKIPSTIFGSGINEELLEKAFGMTSKQIGNIKKRFNPKKA